MIPAKIPPGTAPVSGQRYPDAQAPVEVLLVTNREGTHALFRQVFENSKWLLQTAGSVLEAIERLRRSSIAVVIHGDAGEPGHAPEGDPQEAWVELLTATRHLEHPPKVIVASRQADDRLWADVLHLGGYDVLTLPLENPEVMRTVGMAWLEWKREREAPIRAMAGAAH